MFSSFKFLPLVLLSLLFLGLFNFSNAKAASWWEPVPIDKKPILSSPNVKDETPDGCDMSPYISSVQRLIYQNWQPLRSHSSLTSEYTFGLSKMGSLIGSKLKRSSGNDLFDQLANQAITNTIYPPLPSCYKRESLTIDFYFDYDRH